MDLERIKRMNDEELSKLLRQLSSKGTKVCARCNKPAMFNVKIENIKAFQTRKLCGLCEKHYLKLLDYLNLYDIPWDE